MRLNEEGGGSVQRKRQGDEGERDRASERDRVGERKRRETTSASIRRVAGV